MTDFISDFRAALRAKLRCPRCGAANRPGASYVDIDDTGARAYCTVCSCAGPLDTFKPKEN